MRALPAIGGALLATCITAGANDALNFWNTNPPLNSRATAAPPLDIRPAKQRRADPQIVAMVDRMADRFGVPREIARFHVDRESGWRVTAKNPASTATGLFQPVRGSQAAIIGRPLTKAEHRALAVNPEHNAAVGLAHIRACLDARPNWTAERLWRGCHIKGHAAVGTSIQAAREHYARVVEGRVTGRDAPFDTNRQFGIAVRQSSTFAVAALDYR